jgi:predicted transposase/invertase (TIGR01784 family)
MSDLSNPHDKFFKEAFSYPEVARDFLAQQLPSDVLAHIDLNTLELQKDTFVDPELAEHFSDMLYRVQTRENTAVYLYLLLEHKSYPEPFIALQLLRYLVRMWEQDLREQRPQLRQVVPLVVYHGSKKWRVSTNFAGLFTGDEALRPYWPQFDYILYDLSRYSDAEIRGAALTKITQLILRHIFDPHLADKLPNIFQLFRELAHQETALQFLETVLRYLSAASDQVSQDDLVHALQTVLTDETGETLMTTLAQQWLEQGKLQGIQQGLEKGLEQGLEQGLSAMRSSILDLLKIRFDTADLALVQDLEKINDLDTLRAILTQAATADSVTPVFQSVAEAVQETSA